MIEPELVFSPWTLWSDRDSIADLDFPGVYLLAHFEVAPSSVEPDAEPIIYIGEATDQTIEKRFYQLNRSAFQGKPGHSGGLTYSMWFGGKGEMLYVTAFPLKMESYDARCAFNRYLERKLIWHYVRRWGRLPRCNNK